MSVYWQWSADVSFLCSDFYYLMMVMLMMMMMTDLVLVQRQSVHKQLNV